MKKIIAIILAVLALSALTVTAFAAGSAEPETAEAAAPAAEETTAAAALTEEQALAAALTDAGEAEENVTVTKNSLSEKETADGGKIAVYTVKFSTETTAYKYILDANTGAVLYKSLEFQSPDVVFQSRGKGEERGKSGGETDREDGTTVGKTRSGKASGEMNAESSGTSDADSVTGASTRGGRRSDSGRAASGAPADETALTDTTAA